MKAKIFGITPLGGLKFFAKIDIPLGISGTGIVNYIVHYMKDKKDLLSQSGYADNQVDVELTQDEFTVFI